jgi:amidase
MTDVLDTIAARAASARRVAPAHATSRPADPVGAFCGHHSIRIPGQTHGPLAGLSFAVKDLFDVAGVTACCGNPTWLETHAPAARTAPAIAALLDAGATLVGVTLTDELALSLTGENAHYGTPVNIRCPGRVPGGSSSGSAAAVAAELCDFALGTDTGGSVRVPASHCGIYGFRPTHGAVATDGVCPLAPRFDTVGWFARDATSLARVGERLLPADARRDLRGDLAPPPLVVGADAAAFLDEEARGLFARAATSLGARLGTRTPETIRVAGTGAPATDWCATFLTLQNAQLAALHGDWIARHRPRFGSLIAGRFAGALAVDEIAVAPAESARAALDRLLDDHLGDRWLIWPSAAGAAPPRGLPDAETNALTARALALGALASLSGRPQISLPLATVGGCPLGVSLIGPRGADRALLAAAVAIETRPHPSMEDPS